MEIKMSVSSLSLSREEISFICQDISQNEVQKELLTEEFSSLSEKRFYLEGRKSLLEERRRETRGLSVLEQRLIVQEKALLANIKLLEKDPAFYPQWTEATAKYNMVLSKLYEIRKATESTRSELGSIYGELSRLYQKTDSIPWLLNETVGRINKACSLLQKAGADQDFVRTELESLRSLRQKESPPAPSPEKARIEKIASTTRDPGTAKISRLLSAVKSLEIGKVSAQRQKMRMSNPCRTSHTDTLGATVVTNLEKRTDADELTTTTPKPSVSAEVI
jgi:hypothetical protein